MTRIRTSLALVCAVAVCLSAAAQQARTKILDTDIGTDIDDAWAVGYALKSPKFELLGVTITDGDMSQRARLACKLLHRLGRADVPVAVGRQTVCLEPKRDEFMTHYLAQLREK